MNSHDQKPAWIDTLAIFYVFHPVVNTLYLMDKNNLSFSQTMTSVPFTYYILILMTPFIAYALYKFSKLALPLVAVHTILAVFQTVVSATGSSRWASPSIYFNSLFLLLIGYALYATLYKSLENGQVASEDRVKDEIPVKISIPILSTTHLSQTFDLSTQGCFVALDKVKGILPGTSVNAVMSFNDGSKVETEGKIAWINAKKGKSQYPVGVGISFENLFEAQHAYLNHYLDKCRMEDLPFSRKRQAA